MKSLTGQIVSLSLIIIFSSLFSVNSLAEKTTEIYKWVDKDGRVHYAARPGDNSAKKLHLGSNIFHNQTKKNKQKKAEKKNKERDKLCQDSKDTLTKYKNAPFLYRYDDKAQKKIRLTESETEETFLQAEKDVSYWCNPLEKKAQK